MSLHTNGLLTLAATEFRLIDDGQYTLGIADPNRPDTLVVASTLDSKGTRNVKIERKVWLPEDANNKTGAYYRDYRVIQIPRHTMATDAMIKAAGDQIMGLNTLAFIAAIRRGEK